ncbi:SDR family NAD(P)-dependent oxidoreductase [Evansella sp. AB-rgal1]|uniref:SDR family NAD(P)-dependent oxidoreductase n=1 Tax=Evansella sp. AB-rgal1 TaxID=3242696 RepID=UPI00359F05FF
MINKTVLITGASSGIGYELAKIFAGNKYNLILVARNTELLTKIKEELADDTIDIVTISKDLSSPGAPKDLYNHVKDIGMHVHVLVNNAGYGMTGKFTELELEKQTNMMQLNMFALTELTHLFAQDMVEKKYGRVLNVGSVASFVSVPSMSVYAATKSYVLSFSESLHSELRRKGDIAVTALCPGPTKTNFAKVANVGEMEPLFNKYGMTATDVAKIGYKAVLKGDPVVVPGFTFRFVASLPRFLPRKLIQTLLGKQ